MKNVINMLLIGFIVCVLIARSQTPPKSITPQVAPQVAPQVIIPIKPIPVKPKPQPKPIDWGKWFHDWNKTFNIEWNWKPQPKPAKPVVKPVTVEPIKPVHVLPVEPVKPEFKLKLENVKTYAEALEYCKERKGNMFVIIGADWCPACHSLKNACWVTPGVKGDRDINDFLLKNKILLVYYLNVDKNQDVISTLNVATNSLPTYTFFINGKPSKWVSGYGNPELFLEWAKTNFTTKTECCPGGKCN